MTQIAATVVSVLVLGAAALAIWNAVSKQKKSREEASRAKAEAIKIAEMAEESSKISEKALETEKEEDVHEAVIAASLKPQDDPQSAFPSMLAEVGDADAEFASAFTYENLQDSMLTSGREARDAVKSRSPWSRFGNRSNPEIWESQMDEMRKEIKASGQTLEQFMETSWAPIPEQMAAFWKESDNGSQIPEVRSERVVNPTKAALSEAPSLTRDATQTIGTDVENAFSRMTEILDARKRAKTLRLTLPPLSEEQKNDLQHWSSSKADSKLVGIAKTLANM